MINRTVIDTYEPSPQIVNGAYVTLRLRDPWCVVVSIDCFRHRYFIRCIDVVVIVIILFAFVVTNCVFSWWIICMRFVVMIRVICLSCPFSWCGYFSVRNGLYLLALFVSHGIIVFTATNMQSPWIIYRLDLQTPRLHDINSTPLIPFLTPERS